MILKLLLNTQMMWMIFTKILKNTIQIKRKVLIVFDDMIADILSNEKLNYLSERKKAKHLFCFYHTISFCCAKNC